MEGHALSPAQVLCFACAVVTRTPGSSEENFGTNALLACAKRRRTVRGSSPVALRCAAPSLASCSHARLASVPPALHAESFTPTRRFERRSSLFAVPSGNTRCAQYLRPAHRSSHSLTACFACFLHAARFAAWTTTRHTNPVLTITRCWCAPRAAHGTCELVGRMCLCSSEPFGRVILLVVAARARPHLRFRKTLKAHSVLRACLLDALARRI